MNQESSGLDFDWKRPQSFFAVALAAATSPRVFFAQLPGQGSWLPPIVFFLLAQLPPALVTLLYYLPQGLGLAFTRLAYNLLAPLVMAVACGVLLFASVQIFARASALTLQLALRLVCYSCGVLMLSFVPWFMSPLAGLLLSAIMFALIVYLIGVGLRVRAGLPRLQMLLSLSLSIFVVAATYLWLSPAKTGQPDPAVSGPATPAPPQPAAPPP